MIDARMKLSEDTNKVLNIIKAKYELKDKSEALNKFTDICGHIFTDKTLEKAFQKKDYMKFMKEMQKEKMKELWDNKEDESWNKH